MSAGTHDSDPMLAYKASFFHHSRLIHLNNAGVAPLSAPSRAAIEFWTRKIFEEGYHSMAEAVAMSERTRASLARNLGASTSEVAFFQTTSAAISQVAFGFGLQPGDEVLTWDQEYPSSFSPWKIASERAHAKLVIAPSTEEFGAPAEILLKHVTPKTKVITFSWVQYRTGAIADLKAITDFARQRGIFTCCDIIQGAGVLPFDFHESGLDVACGGSQKWLCSGPSVGFMLIRDSQISRLQPITIGAMTYGGPDALATDPLIEKNTALRFEPGTRIYFDLASLGAALDLIHATGIDRIAQEAEWLNKSLANGLRERGYTIHSPHGHNIRGAILNFSSGRDSRWKTPEKIAEVLAGAGVSLAHRPPGIRLSPHAFNTAEEIDRVLSLL